VPDYPMSTFEQSASAATEIREQLKREGQQSEGVVKMTYHQDERGNVKACYLTVPRGRPQAIARKVLRRRGSLRRGGWHNIIDRL
jgi:hypothetical protein